MDIKAKYLVAFSPHKLTYCYIIFITHQSVLSVSDGTHLRENVYSKVVRHTNAKKTNTVDWLLLILPLISTVTTLSTTPSHLSASKVGLVSPI